MHVRSTQEKGLAVLIDSNSGGNLDYGQKENSGSSGIIHSDSIEHGKTGTVIIHPPRHPHTILIHLGASSKPPLSSTATSQLPADLDAMKLSDKFCIHNSSIPPGQFCLPNCDKCPKWGAKECLFGKQPFNITSCDNCLKYGSPGCVFHDSKLNTIIAAATATNDSKKC